MKSVALQMARANKSYMCARATVGVLFPVALSRQANFGRIFGISEETEAVASNGHRGSRH